MSKPVESHGLANDSSSVCPTIVIPDDPETEDLLGGSPHSNVAKAIVDLMRSAERSVSIGLEGSWGSGKTTVIKLLIKQLSAGEVKDPQQVFTVVPFDAWTHEGDPLRRAFLESLIQKLKEVGWIDATQAQRRIDILAQRLEEKSVENSPVLTGWGRLIGVSLLLIPIGSVFLTRSLRDIELTLNWSYPIAWRVIWSLGMMTLPFWIALIAYLVKKDDSLWSTLFSKVTYSKESSKTIKTPNPTANEFLIDFNEVMEEALADERHKIVVIVDNLDRVDAEDALSIWSTLQTFVKQSHFDPRPWLNRFWIIVAYDRDGIRKLWEQPQATNAIPDENRGALLEKSDISSAFLDKSFQVRFEVPPPVLSDWRNALFKFLRKAFPAEHHRKEDHAVHNTLAIYFAQHGTLPTIRELKVIVNQMGVVHRQWALTLNEHGGAEFPLSHMAYYVLLKRKPVKIIDELRAGNLPGEPFKDVLGEETADTLASLVFDVEKERAREIILRKPIEDALIVGDSDSLVDLADTHDGFWDVLQTVVSSFWLGGKNVDGARLSTAVRALARSRLLDVETTPLARKVLATLLRAAPRVRYWPFFDLNKGESLVELCRWNHEWSERPGGVIVAGLESKLLKTVSDSLAWFDQNGQLQVVKVDDWLTGLNILTTTLPSTRQSSGDFRMGLVLPLVQRLQPNEDGRPQGLHGREIAVTLEAVYRLAGQNSDVRSELESLVKGNDVLRLLRPPGVDENTKANAWCLFIQMAFTQETAAIVHEKSKTEPYTTFFNHLNNVDTNVVAQFVEIIDSPDELGRIFSFLEPGPFFLREYLRTAISGRKLDALTPEVLWTHWRVVRSAFDSELIVRHADLTGAESIVITPTFRTFVSTLLRPGSPENLPSYLMARDFLVNRAELYAAVLFEDRENSEFREWVSRSLEKWASPEQDLPSDIARHLNGLRQMLAQINDAARPDSQKPPDESSNK